MMHFTYYKDQKTIFLTKNPKLYVVISWIKSYKPHKKKNIHKCHKWILITKFDPTSKFKKKWFLILTLVIWPPEYETNILILLAISFFCRPFFSNLFFNYFFRIFGKHFKSLAWKMTESAILFFVGNFFLPFFCKSIFKIFFLEFLANISSL